MARAIVVGAGLGGLTAAIRLAARGWDVTIYEKNADPGGRAGGISAGGYTWDAGPTLIMMPEILQELFAAAGRQIEDYLDLRRVDPYYRVAFEEGGHLDLTGNLPAMVAAVEAIEPGAGRQYLRFFGHAERLSRLTRGSIIERPFNGMRDLLNPAVLASLLRSRPFHTVASEVAAHFRSSALRRAFSFQTLYLGTSPDRTPAAYLMIPFVEAALGVWYPIGGTRQIGQAMARLARELGVTVRTGAPVARILTVSGRAVGVALEDGTTDRADAVVANAEWAYTQRLLLDGGERVLQRDHGASAVLFCLAVRGEIAGPHHTFLLSADFEGNLADIFERRVVPEHPSIYLCRPTATDPTLAPAGVELLYVLVPCPTLQGGIDWGRRAARPPQEGARPARQRGNRGPRSPDPRRDGRHARGLQGAPQPDARLRVRHGRDAAPVRAVPADDSLPPVSRALSRGRERPPRWRRADRGALRPDGGRRDRGGPPPGQRAPACRGARANGAGVVRVVVALVVAVMVAGASSAGAAPRRLPAVVFQDQEGRVLDLGSLRGRVAVIVYGGRTGLDHHLAWGRRLDAELRARGVYGQDEPLALARCGSWRSPRWVASLGPSARCCARSSGRTSRRATRSGSTGTTRCRPRSAGGTATPPCWWPIGRGRCNWWSAACRRVTHSAR